MATINQNIESTWEKIADDSDENLLATWNSAVQVQVATTATDAAPTVEGHALSRKDAITRAVIGPGFVWVRLFAGYYSSITMIISK